MRTMLYLIGPSGCGKSTILREAMAPAVGTYVREENMLHTMQYPSGAVVLGRDRDQFSGTDTLSFSIAREAERYVRETEAPLLIGEGDRLAYDRFFENAATHGWDLTVVYLDTPLEECLRRGAERGATLPTGKIKATATKSARLAGTWTHPQWWLDGMEPKDVLVKRLREHPAIQSAGMSHAHEECSCTR